MLLAPSRSCAEKTNSMKYMMAWSTTDFWKARFRLCPAQDITVSQQVQM